MSIADKITQLTTIRGDIRTALAGKGVSASDHNFADFATDISSISTGGLPSEYEAVEYIESMGTQYIDTGLKPDKNTAVRLTNAITALPSTYGNLFGVTDSNFTTNYYAAAFDSSRVMCRQRMASGYWWYGVGINDKHTLIFGAGNIGLNYESAAYSLNSYSSIPAINEFDNFNNLSFYLFALNKENTAVELASARIYLCQIFNNYTGEMYRNFVPCKRKADDEAGLYDLVNGVFYTNQGTGDFVVPT